MCSFSVIFLGWTQELMPCNILLSMTLTFNVSQMPLIVKRLTWGALASIFLNHITQIPIPVNNLFRRFFESCTPRLIIEHLPALLRLPLGNVEGNETVLDFWPYPFETLRKRTGLVLHASGNQE